MSEMPESLSPLRVRPQPELRIGKSERARAAILNAALQFIWTHPFRDMTVNLVMRSTGLGRSAFYQYFKDLHQLMESLLAATQEEMFVACSPWLTSTGDPVALIQETLAALVRVSYRRGPIFRAIADAAATDKRFEKAWKQFLGRFDDAATARIEADQKQGLIPHFEARPVAIALNRLDAYTLIDAFGHRPRRRPDPVRKALARVWISTLYGAECGGKESSKLVRK